MKIFLTRASHYYFRCSIYLVGRCASPVVLEKLKELVASFATNISVELQQRGLEYSQLFGPYDNLRSGLLERIPPLENRQAIRDRQNAQKTAGAGDSLSPNVVATEAREPVPVSNSNSSALLDLLGLDAEPAVQVNNVQGPASNKDNLLDMLLDFGAGGENPTPAAHPTSNHSIDGLLDGFGDVSSTFNNVGVPNKPPALSFYDKHGVKLELEFDGAERDPTSTGVTAVMTLRATNASIVDSVENFLFQAAVPKSFQLQLAPPSGVRCPAGGRITQQIRVKCSSTAPPQLRMRVKLSFTIGGTSVSEQCEVNDFPASCWTPK